MKINVWLCENTHREDYRVFSCERECKCNCVVHVFQNQFFHINDGDRSYYSTIVSNFFFNSWRLRWIYVKSMRFTVIMCINIVIIWFYIILFRCSLNWKQQFVWVCCTTTRILTWHATKLNKSPLEPHKFITCLCAKITT